MAGHQQGGAQQQQGGRVRGQEVPPQIPPQIQQPLLLGGHTHACTKNKSQCRFKFPRQISNEHAFKQTDNLLQQKNFYDLKRNANETMINAYNPILLTLWNANMDVQLIGSAIGAAYYITSYICKPETKELKQSILNAQNE